MPQKKRVASLRERIDRAGGLGVSERTERALGKDTRGPLGVLSRTVSIPAANAITGVLQLAGHGIDWIADEADSLYEGSTVDRAVAKATGVHQRPSELIGGMVEAFPMGFPEGSSVSAGALASRGRQSASKAAPKARQAARELARDTEGSVPRSGPKKARTGVLSSDRLEGAPAKVQPNPVLRGVAQDYAKSKGMNYTPPTKYYPVDEERGSRIAHAYDSMRHAPDDPRVKEAYSALDAEAMDQYRALRQAGFDFEFNPSSGDPYGGNPWEATRDINANRHLYVFPTDAGFGTLNEFPNNPLLDFVQGETWGGQPVRKNDIFRAVHDAFGHAKEGVGFRAAGEENAYLQHAAMFSPEARHALASETRGQNSWLNFGPYGERNRNASVEDTIFADQKTGLMPRWTMEEGTEDFLPREQIALQHFSHSPDLLETDPSFRGSNPNRGFTSREDLARGPMTDFGVNTGKPGGYRVEDGVGPYAYEATVPKSSLVEVGSPEWDELVTRARPIVDNASKRLLARMRGQKFDGPGDDEWERFTSILPSSDNGVGLLDGLARDNGYAGILYPSERSELGSIAKTWNRVPVLRRYGLDKN